MGYAEFEWLRRQLMKEISWIPTKQNNISTTFTVTESDKEVLIAEHHMTGAMRGYLNSVMLQSNSFSGATARIALYVDDKKASTVTGNLYHESFYPSGGTDHKLGYADMNYMPNYNDAYDTIVHLKQPIMFKDLEIRVTPIGTDWVNKKITADYMIDEVDT